MNKPADVIAVPLAAVPLVSVIIPAKAELDYLMAALRSLERHGAANIPFETIVVLDDPIDRLAAALDVGVRGVTVVASSVNLGLAGALNLGRSAARGQLLIVLHDDAEVEPGWMEALVKTAQADPRAGAIGGKAMFPDGTLQGAGYILWRDASTSPPWTGAPPPADTFSELRPVDYCGSSSLLVRAEVWDAIGGIDERYYPAYYVDVDIAMSVRRYGYDVLYQPASVIRHHRSASSGPHWREFVTLRNRTQFVDKWRDELADYEPPDHDVGAAIARALARASMAAATRRSRDLAADLPPVSLRRDGDAAVLGQALAATNDYAAWLLQSLRAADEETEALRLELRAQASSVYVAGEYLSFGIDGAAYRYHKSGGHAPEAWGVWLGAEPFYLVLPTPVVPVGNRRVQLELDATPLIVGRRGESPFTVSINGAVVLDVVETAPGVRRYAVDFDLPDGDAATAIAIVGGNPCSPESLGVSTDARLLSVGLIGLVLNVVTTDESGRPLISSVGASALLSSEPVLLVGRMSAS